MDGVNCQQKILIGQTIVIACLVVFAADVRGENPGEALRFNCVSHEIAGVEKARRSPGYLAVHRALEELIKGDFKAALTYADMAVDKDSRLGVAYVIRGLTYAELDEPQKAVEDLTRSAVSPEAKGVRYWDVLARSDASLQRWDPALAAFDQAISLSPKDVWRYKERGDIYAFCKKNDLALRDYNTGIKIAPDDPGPLSARAQFYKGVGRYDDALADCNRVVLLSPNDPRAYGCRADIYAKLGRNDLAAKDRQTANRKGYHDLEPGSPADLLKP